MGATPLNALPYPEATETPYVHLDLKELAEAIDPRLTIVCTSSTRPAHRAGRIIYETNTGTLLTSDGTAWRYLSGSAPVSDVGSGGGGYQTFYQAALDPATIVLPQGGIWQVSGEMTIASSPSAPVLYSTVLWTGAVQVGATVITPVQVAGVNGTHTVEFSKIGTFAAGTTLTMRSATSALGGTQNFGEQVLSAHRIG